MTGHRGEAPHFSGRAYSHEIGHPVQFDKNDIRLLAQTLVINAHKERAA